MLLVKYILEDFDTQTIETQTDIYSAIRVGLQTGLLKHSQVSMLITYAMGYTLQEIATTVQYSFEQVKELVIAACTCIAELSGYTDERVMFNHKGRIEDTWIAKRNNLIFNME